MGYLTQRLSNLLKANLNYYLGRTPKTRSNLDLEDLSNEFEQKRTREKQQKEQTKWKQQQEHTQTSVDPSLPDYYEILEVHHKASQEVIEKAYKTLATKYHPDKQPRDRRSWAETKMKQINEAYFHLRDPQKRREYDGKRGYPSR